ncbi:MAG: glycosyltransferase family 4 protein, partial [Candidatus Paceibacterota bacterium]
TSDRDFLCDIPYQNIEINEWNNVGNAEVFYLSPKQITFTNIKFIINTTEFDLLYLNSLFNQKFTLIPLALYILLFKNKSYNILIAPRGELSLGALEQKKIKKKLFLKFLKYSGIKDNIYWHATDKTEKNDIIRELGIDKENIFVASNLPAKVKNKTTGVSNKSKNSLKMVYLSRITFKKNISYFIEILGEIRDLDLELHLYGTVDDDRYWSQCLKKIHALPSNITVLKKGHLEHSEVLDVLSGYDLFVLPTKGENYGHAIVEAISAGTPVLISTNTPWRNLEEKKVGWDFDLENKEKFIGKIRELAKLNSDEMNKIKQTVKAKSIEVLGKNSVAHTKDMLQDLISNA